MPSPPRAQAPRGQLPRQGAHAEPKAAGSHYQDVAQSYEAAFFYSSQHYQHWVLSHLLEHLRLPDQAAGIVDLGGGTGNFTSALAGAAGAARRALCVDPFPDMLSQAVGRPGLEPLLLDAAGFAGLAPGALGPVTHLLLKEVVHHLPQDRVLGLYAGLHAQLAPGGRVVTITRPQEVDYPLFQLARQIWWEHQPPADLFLGAMRSAGFRSVALHAHEYPAELPKDMWLDMMRARFWSTFSHCTDQQLEEGIAEVAAAHEGSDSVRFVDRLLFLVAEKEEKEEHEAEASKMPHPGQPPEQQEPGPSRHTAAWKPVLSATQRAQYTDDGYCGPVEALTPAEASQALACFERYEAVLGGAVSGDWRFKAHLLLPWLWDLVHHPNIVGAASDALRGVRSLLCWSTDIFVKEPGDGAYASWHQDSTYVGLHPAEDVVTVWLALTASGPANGCLRFLPGSHKQQLPHVDTYSEGNLLLKGQAIQELEGMQGSHVDLAPGQASLHSLLVAHASGPADPGSGRRVGIALRYMAAHVRQDLEPRDFVTLVRGLDSFGLYQHEERPQVEMGATEQARHATAVRRVYPDGYIPR